MKPISILFALLCSTQCLFGQQLSKEDSLLIDRFKKDYHKEITVAAYYDTIEGHILPTLWSFNDSLCLGDLILEKSSWTDEEENKIRHIKTFRKGNLILDEYYYDGSPQLKNVTEFDEKGNKTGIYREYLKNGKPDQTFDYNTLTWTVYNMLRHPYYKEQMAMKAKGDSIIIERYGRDFFTKNVIFNASLSKVTDSKSWSYWTDKLEEPPVSYMLSYNVKIDEQNSYSRIGLTFSPAGVFDPENSHAFEAGNPRTAFKMTFAGVLKEAIRQGFPESDTSKADGTLVFEGEDGSRRFLYYLTIPQTEGIPSGSYDRKPTYKYLVYVFNPWTGQFIEKKKMKTWALWEYIKDYQWLSPDTE